MLYLQRISYRVILYVALMPLLATRLEAATIRGFVKDIRNGETLSYVNVILKGTYYGTTTDKSGYYVISGIPSGKYTLLFSMIGYKVVEKDISIKPKETLTIDALLEPEPILMKEIVVSAERERFKREVAVGLRHMEVRDLRLAAGFLEQDLISSIQILPGVITVNDWQNLLYVRGGKPDENLILLDGMSIYDPYHINTLFSIFNIDAIKSAELLAGGFPAEYSGKISSVLNVETRTGNTQQFCGKGELSLASAKLVLEGPIPKGSWLVSARRTYVDKLIEAYFKINPPKEEVPEDMDQIRFYFYDLYGKLDFDISPKLRISLLGFCDDDILYNPGEEPGEPPEFDYRWGNSVLGLKFRYIPSPKLFSTLLLTKSRYRAKSQSSYEVSSFLNKINNYSVKGDISYLLSNRHSIKVGLELKSLTSKSKAAMEIWQEDTGFDTLNFINYNKEADHFSLYIQDEFKPTEHVITNAGIRYDYFSSGNYSRIAPRLGIKFLLDANFALKCAYGHYYQFVFVPSPDAELLEEMRTGGYPARMYQSWYPADKSVKPVGATHYVLGATKWLASDISLDIESYYKDIKNIVELKSMDSIMRGGSELRVGTGNVIGLELLLKRKTSWISYTYSIAKKTIGGTTLYAFHDCRHKFNIAWNFEFRKNWSGGIRWTYRSGIPFAYSGPVGAYQYMWAAGGRYGTPWEPTPMWYTINGTGTFRGSPYHRLDIIINNRFKMFKHVDTSLFIQVLNLYNRSNAAEYEYWTNWYSGKLEKQASYNMFPIVPSIGIRARF